MIILELLPTKLQFSWDTPEDFKLFKEAVNTQSPWRIAEDQHWCWFRAASYYDVSRIVDWMIDNGAELDIQEGG